jgi:phage shock protein PspC (stress-responsive transcriptional regulator)
VNSVRRFYRPPDALLAGVCAELARRLGWNVWAIRLLFIVGLLVQAPATGALYLVMALVMGFMLGERDDPSAPRRELESEDLSDRARRIRELEEKFRSMERDGR